jgi:acyl-CoA synthetase (NDP forming)
MITPERLHSLMRPRGVALVGAADKSGFSRNAFDNFERFSALDRLTLVNRSGGLTHGRQAVTSCSDLPADVDLAYLMVPKAGILDALTEAHGAGVRNAVILSSGYAEMGEGGRAAEAELIAHAQSLDMVLLGPNVLGFANFVDAIPVCSIPVPHQPTGPVALLSQSGASSAAMLDFARMIDVGLSYIVTLGNEAMVTAGHLIDFVVDDPHTKAIALFVESIREPEVFRRAALRAAEAGKAIVALKAGSSELSARAASAHTGALVGDDRVIDAVFADLGVMRVDSIEDMLITAGAAAHLGQLSCPGVGVVSISGGACDIVADRAEDVGLELPTFAAETMTEIGRFFPDYGTVQNPLDVTGAAVIDSSIFTKSITAVGRDPSVGAVAVISTIPWLSSGGPWNGAPVAAAIGAGMQTCEVPAVWVNQVLQPNSEYTRTLMEDAGVPFVLPGLRSAVVALKKIGVWSQRLRELQNAEPPVFIASDPPNSNDRRGTWSEVQARNLLEAVDIPVSESMLAQNADEAVVAASKFAGPVAMKVVSPDILHKTEIGGVRLGVSGESDVQRAYDELCAAGAGVPNARIDGVLVSPMRSSGVELLVGVVPDAQWGPVLVVALGGVFVEVMADSVASTLPVSASQVRRMLARLRGASVLDGFRGAPPANLDALADVIARIGALALALGDDLTSLEINPLLVDGSRIEALDAVVEWRSR